MKTRIASGLWVFLTVAVLLGAACSNPFGSGSSGSTSGGSNTAEQDFPPPIEFAVFATTGLPDITLHWAEPNSSVNAYRVFRSESSGDYDFSAPIAEISSAGPEYSYVDTTAAMDTLYYYVVEALAGGSVADTSEEVSATARAVSAVADLDFVYVDPSAPDGGNGSSGEPFNSIAAGVAGVNAGGTVLLFNGVYQLITSVGIEKQVVIRSATGSYLFSEAIINAGEIGNTAAVEFLGGSDGSILQGVRITGAVRTSSSKGTIQVGSNSGNAPNDVKVLHNHLYANQGVGISNYMDSGESHRTVIAGNWITDHSGGGSVRHAVRIRDGLLGGRFEYNIIENVEDSGAGINIDNASGFTIAGNHFKNIGGHGINLGGGTNNFTVSDNLLEHTNTGERADGGGIRMYGASHTTSVVIAGNTIVNSFNNIYQRDDDISASDITIENNTIVAPAPGSWLIYNAATTGILVTRGNWFGSADEDDFRDDIGGAEEDNVDYSDWLTSAP